MYGIIDADNCYVSCERVFRPDLEHAVVVVLSNNDGCIVARSNEAKALGIKAGTPYYQLAQQFPNTKIAVFSSNYELYGELTGRIVSLIAQEVPAYFRYSIDECFVYLDGMNHLDLKQWGENLHKKIKRYVGMPVSIGLAPNKTLAKMASHFAKKYQGYRHCCMIDSDEKRIKALKLYPIEDVWGIGRRYAAKLQALGVHTAYDFAQHHKDWVRLTFNNINIVRTWQELNGEDVVPNEELAKKKSICTSRSFNGMIGDIETLRTHVSNYAARCAEKLRMQNTVASIVGVFLNTNAFREDLPQYWNFQEQRLITPTSSTITITQTANQVLEKIYRQGYQYKKAGVIVMGIGADSPIQQDLFDINAEQFQKMKRLDEVVDRINRMHGSETIVLGSQQYTKKDGKGKADVFANAIKHDFKSPSPTTRWGEIMKLNANAKKKERMIEVREATKNLAAEIACLIMTAMTDDCCLYFCGEGYGLEDFRKMMTILVECEDSQYSYRNTLVAMDADKVVGISVSYDGERLHELRHAFIEAAKEHIGKDHSGMDDETQAGELYLDSLAVLPEYRRQGIARKLLLATKERANLLGLPRVGLLVDKDNPVGEALYTSVGFQYVNDNQWGGHPMKHLIL